jgi:hypothetical protein
MAIRLNRWPTLLQSPTEDVRFLVETSDRVYTDHATLA